MQYWQEQATVEQQLAEIDVLKGVINAAERDMLKMRRRYESQAISRPSLESST